MKRKVRFVVASGKQVLDQYWLYVWGKADPIKVTQTQYKLVTKLLLAYDEVYFEDDVASLPN